MSILILIQEHVWGIAGVVVGFFGAAAAVWEGWRVTSARRMLRQQCETRCKNLVELVKELARVTNSACRIKDEHFDNLMLGRCDPQEVVRHLRELSDQIQAVAVSRDLLVRFCENLNEEHVQEFGKPVFESIRHQFPELVSPSSDHAMPHSPDRAPSA